MPVFSLALVYIAFIGLGLPDSLLGAVWPVMRVDLGAPLGAAGILSTILSGGTILSSLASEKLVRRFGVGLVTATSVLATALALAGFSVAPSLFWLAALAVPLGLGAGAVDAALNNYVALNFQAKHMSWLHCFWGVGAFAGPLLLAGFIRSGHGWRSGYLAIGLLQTVIAALLFLSLALRRAGDSASQGDRVGPGSLTAPGTPALKIPGVPFALATFLFYCAVEYSTGLWSASFLVDRRGVSEAWAARGAALFYGGITAGRFLNGFLARRFTGPRLIRAGGAAVLAGGLLLALPHPACAFAGLAVVGLGCAPVYPSMIHETPARFGRDNSQRIIGLQMATAYCGSTFLPPLLGFSAERFGMGIFPFALLLFAAAMFAASEAVTRVAGKG